MNFIVSFQGVQPGIGGGAAAELEGAEEGWGAGREVWGQQGETSPSGATCSGEMLKFFFFQMFILRYFTPGRQWGDGSISAQELLRIYPC